MREAANEAGTLKALWVGLGGVGNLIFNGTEIKRARDEVARIQELVDSTRKKVDTGKARRRLCPSTSSSTMGDGDAAEEPRPMGTGTGGAKNAQTT